MSQISTMISKFLGISIIAGSAGIKVPQILNIKRNSSCIGISKLSILLEFLCGYIHCLYSSSMGYSLMNWGESLLILIQNLYIIHLFGVFDNNKPWKLASIFIGTLAASSYYLFDVNNKTLMNILRNLQAGNVLIFAMAKFSQIYSTFKIKVTKSLSLTTALLALIGQCARVFTTFQEMYDPVLLTSYGLGVVLNSIVVLQFYLYRNNDIKFD